mmetsp:Transcript_2220/g.3430  ORF Transcript_2220/g.3430 Transcript_2220/m.3430 type:complete len:291 (+) Transcript_2220:82-954(+)
MGMCAQPPSPALWFSVPAIFAVLFFRVYFFPAGLTTNGRSSRGRGRNRWNWALWCHYTSIMTVLAWVAFECAAFVSFCQFPCANKSLRTRTASFALGNFCQYAMYFARWKAVDSKSLKTSKVDRPLIFLICIFFVINLGVALLVVATGSYGSTCEFDSVTQRNVAIFSVLDTLIGVFFPRYFLTPSCGESGRFEMATREWCWAEHSRRTGKINQSKPCRSFAVTVRPEHNPSTYCPYSRPCFGAWCKIDYVPQLAWNLCDVSRYWKSLEKNQEQNEFSCSKTASIHNRNQ